MVVAWLAPYTAASHECVSGTLLSLHRRLNKLYQVKVHVAHAPIVGRNLLPWGQPLRSDVALGLGVFDISESRRASTLALFLKGHLPDLLLCAQAAQDGSSVPSAHPPSQADVWRIDQVEDEGTFQHTVSCSDRMDRWLSENW